MLNLKCTLVLALYAAVGFAVPNEDELNEKSVTCGAKRYTLGDVNTSILDLFTAEKAGKNTTFPQKFLNKENINFGDAKPPLYIYPLSTPAWMTNGPPGPDRFVVSGDYKYVGSIHEVKPGAFEKCIEAS